MAKIRINKKNIQPFGGIFFIMHTFSQLSFGKIIDETLGKRGKHSDTTSYSSIISSLFFTDLCGGEHLEDIKKEVVRNTLCSHPGTVVPSPDTIGRGLKELATENIVYTSDSGAQYSFNDAAPMNKLLMKLLLRTGQLKSGGEIDVDFDHQVIATEKYDAKMSYKKCSSYFPGAASSDGLMLYVENRDGNTNVRFKQAETLTRMFHNIEEEGGQSVRMFRADCGSFSKDIMEVVAEHSKVFYIRAGNCEQRISDFARISDWRTVEIGFRNYDVASIPFTYFLKELNLRLVVQRETTVTPIGGLFGGQCTTTEKYRAIVTNDWESSEEDIIERYNDRGASERNFDIQNNDFCWSKLPFSFMNQNAVFLVVMAMLKNFYLYLVERVSAVFDSIERRSRFRKFIFEFISVPARWTRSGGQDVLTFYTSRPYDKLFAT